MLNFITGICSSILATIILYFFRYQIGGLLNIILFKIFPKVSGKYTMIPVSIEKSEKDDNPEVIEKTKDGFKFPISTSPREMIEEYNKNSPNSKNRVLVLKQFANRLKGEIILPTKGGIKEIEKVTGKITPSRILLLFSESKDEDHHNFCTYLITLKNDKKYFQGCRSTLCLKCGNAYSHYLLFEKIDK
jgi:hypothetical protein